MKLGRTGHRNSGRFAGFQHGALLNQFILSWWNSLKADGGEVDKISDVNSYWNMAKANGIADSILFGMLGGYNLRTDGNTKYVTKVYSLDSVPNDATQTTEASQPYLTGFIAPNEKWGLKNPNGDSRVINIPSITVTGTVTKVEQTSLTGKFEITQIDVVSQTITSLIPTMNTCAYFIRNITMSTAQKAAEATKLRQIFPEIPSVQIGTQRWATSNFEMVATPMGNTIQEMKANGAVEKVVNGGFDTDTSNWLTDQCTINSVLGGVSGNCLEITRTGFIYQGALQIFTTVPNKYYKVTIYVKSGTSGDEAFQIDFHNNPYSSYGTIEGISTSSWVKYEKYIKATGTNSTIYLKKNTGTSGTMLFDAASVKELGWADSQELYDGLIAQGESVYEATKAAAMWCYYNNDPSLGAIYGKLYNWYAVKLLQNDIDAYNLANPTTPWGWHVPSLAEFNTLATTLGGASVAGGKMKVAGTDYWSSPNNGATNESGFSSIMSGIRTSTFIKTRFYCWAIEIYRNIQNGYDSNQMLNGVDSSIFGMSIRLIKD